MNRSPNQTDHRREILGRLAAREHTYDELLERYRRALPARDVDTREAFAVLVGAMVGEGLLQREVAPEGDPQAGAIRRLWLTEKGRAAVESAGGITRVGPPRTAR